FHKRVDEPLGTSIRSKIRGAVPGGLGTRRNDAPPALLQFRDRCPRHHEDGENVRRNHLLDLVSAIILDRVQGVQDTGVIDQYVELPEAFDGALDTFACGIFVRKIAQEAHGFATTLVHAFNDVVDGIRRAACNDHLRTFTAELRRDSLPDTRGSTRHDCYLVLEPHCISSVCVGCRSPRTHSRCKSYAMSRSGEQHRFACSAWLQVIAKTLSGGTGIADRFCTEYKIHHEDDSHARS